MHSSEIKTRGLFVTGTDTSVGKTTTAAALMARYRGESRMRYWKPVQTGIELDDDTATMRALGCGEDEIVDAGVRLPRPLSPHLAAQLAGTSIEIAPLVGIMHTRSNGRPWIVEGAGGVLVPLNESVLISDLMAALGLPVLLVARSSLGTINHTLLTLEAMRLRDLTVAGVVMVGDSNRENRAAIERFGGVAVVGELPFLTPLDRDSIARWSLSHFDRDNVLRTFLS